MVGNHELYKYYDLAKMPQGLVCTIRSNVKCYYNEVIQIDDMDLILSTLWAKIPLEESYITERGVSDFHRILYNEELLTFDKNNFRVYWFYIVNCSFCKRTCRYENPFFCSFLAVQPALRLYNVLCRFYSFIMFSIAFSSNSSFPFLIPSIVGLTSISGTIPTRWVSSPLG